MTFSDQIKPLNGAQSTTRKQGSATALSNEPTESTLWLEFQQGSDAALATIFERYAHKLFHYGKQFTKDAEIINDAVQDVFYQVIRSKHKLGLAISIKYYLFSSFRRRLLRLLKQRKRIVLDGDF